MTNIDEFPVSFVMMWEIDNLSGHSVMQIACPQIQPLCDWKPIYLCVNPKFEIIANPHEHNLQNI